MVRVHVRPPPSSTGQPQGWRLIFGNGQGRRPATAPMGGDSRGLPPSRERPPRLNVRGGQTNFSLKKLCAAVWPPRTVVF